MPKADWQALHQRLLTKSSGFSVFEIRLKSGNPEPVRGIPSNHTLDRIRMLQDDPQALIHQTALDSTLHLVQAHLALLRIPL
jgi:hypothetical protein